MATDATTNAAEAECCQVVTMYATRDGADEFARLVVDERLAACAHVEGPVTARFWWDGGVNEVTEWRVTCKTTMLRFPELEARIKEHHPYVVPEILALPVLAGSDEYLTWMRTETRPAAGSAAG
jgi:periplasmic divalent cation tolerance protein